MMYLRRFPVGVIEGGPGSGHHGHKGLKGVWGGSSSDGSGKRGSEVRKERTPKQTFIKKHLSGRTDPEKHWPDMGDRVALSRLFGERWRHITPDLLTKINNLTITMEDGSIWYINADNVEFDSRYSGSHDASLFFSGDLIDKYGNRVGNFVREFTRERNDDGSYSLVVVQHELYLVQKFQGRNFSKDYARSVFPMYEALGVDSIKTLATQVGRYSWAKFGFEFDDSEYESRDYPTFADFYRDNLKGALGEYQSRDREGRRSFISLRFGSAADPAVARHKHEHRMKQAKFDIDAFLNFTDNDMSEIWNSLDNFTKPWEYASYTYKGVRVGAALMFLGTAWPGRLRLKGKSGEFAKEYLGLK